MYKNYVRKLGMKAKKSLLKLYGAKLICINSTTKIMCTDLCS